MLRLVLIEGVTILFFIYVKNFNYFYLTQKTSAAGYSSSQGSSQHLYPTITNHYLLSLKCKKNLQNREVVVYFFNNATLTYVTLLVEYLVESSKFIITKYYI